MILFIHNGKLAKERDLLVVRFEDESELHMTVQELIDANGSAADLGEAVTIAGKTGVVIQDPAAKYYKDVTLSTPASVIDAGVVTFDATAVITTAAGTDAVPAVITLGGVFYPGYNVSASYSTNAASGGSGAATAAVTTTAANMAIALAASFDLKAHLTAVAVGATVEILASGDATTCTINSITLNIPTP